MRRALALLALAPVVVIPHRAAAQVAPGRTGAGTGTGDAPSLDVTETAIASQRFDARGNELPENSGWGAWTNRLDAALRWGDWSAGLRLDSAVYWRRPVDNASYAALGAPVQARIAVDGESRFRNAIVPAKLWLTYSAPGVEVTLGDAYVQFGRGLVLSMRKIDELGIDTTVRGAKVAVQKDPFAFIAVAGFANPARIDEATGRALFVTSGTTPAAVFGSDRLVGAELQAGRGLPVTLATHVVRFTHCAPYGTVGTDASGHIVTNFTDNPGGVAFGSCAADDTAAWLGGLQTGNPLFRADDVTMAGQSVEVPTLGGHGKLYLEAATQYRHYAQESLDADNAGNALYASLSADAGPVTGTLEVKSNRNFYPMAPGIDLTRAPEFDVVTYSYLPPAESPTRLDTEFGAFNACVDGGRLRADVRAGDDLLFFGQGIFAYTKSEQGSGVACDARGRTLQSPAATFQDVVWDGLAGVEWTFDDARSHAFVSAGARDDTRESGAFFYRERHAEYSIGKVLGGPFAIEIQGLYRLRKEEAKNLESYAEAWWHEGENYVALKIAPKWVLSQGFEYTTLTGEPTYYLNGSVLYRFSSASNVRLFAGQQRGAFRCVSGVCRFFPPFEGARAELTVRF